MSHVSREMHLKERTDTESKAVGSVLDAQSIGTLGKTDFTFRAFTDIDVVKEIWLTLEKRSNATIYQHYHWVRTWIETHGDAENLLPLFIVAEIQNDPVFLLPLVKKRIAGINIAQFPGGRHANYQMPLVARDAAEAVSDIAPRIVKYLSRQTPIKIDVLALEQQVMAWDRYKNPMTALPFVPAALSGGSVTTSLGFKAVLTRGNAKRKRKKLRQQERLLEPFGGYTFETTSDPEKCRVLFDVFVQQKSEWFQKQGIKDVFDNTIAKEFFHRLCAQNIKGENGVETLRFDFIRAGDDILAILGSGTYANQSFGYFTSIHPDEKYQPISPGALNFYRKIKASSEEGHSRFDLGVGAERYKAQWCDEEHRLCDVILGLSLRGKIYASALRMFIIIKNRLRGNRHLFKLVKRLQAKRAG